MDTILITSGHSRETLQALQEHWHVVDIPDQSQGLEYLLHCSPLPAAVVVGYVPPHEQVPPSAWDHTQSDILLPAHKILPRILQIDPDLPVIISTHEKNPAAVVELVKRGAFDYVIEPDKTNPEGAEEDRYQQELILSLTQAVKWRKTLLENRRLRQNLMDETNPMPIRTRSAAMQHVLERIRKVAPTPATVLITGESGTGKELVARSIHNLSNRQAQPFLAVNCGALSESLLASELFGHARGAFTGANCDSPGLIRQAGGGTLLLDEIGTIPPSFQVMLLRVLENRVARPVGGAGEYPVSCRFLAAANRDLEQLVAEGIFREDLYYRLNVFHIDVPPLRKRTDDISVLANFFLHQTADEYGRQIEGFEPAALAILERYTWPGNVRQLRNAVERAVILSEGSRIRPVDLADYLQTQPASATDVENLNLPQAVEKLETRLIRTALQTTKGNIAQAAALLGVKRTTLNYRIRKLGLST
ncbi:MAG: sigma-54-dependent Fis family transcriptional regulator [Phycisphaerae bacterium]|nr:sigma-54-dependent Fis family transcriptional regulator [Phycisphaerae bacterium]